MDTKGFIMLFSVSMFEIFHIKKWKKRQLFHLANQNAINEIQVLIPIQGS